MTFKELYTKAQKRRMNETGCSFEKAAEWVEQRPIGLLIDYANILDKEDEEEKPWPQIGDIYYSIGSDPSGVIITNHTYTNDDIDKNLRIMNNFFKTEKDALFEYERLRIFHDLKELSDDDQPWNGEAKHWQIVYDYEDMNIIIIDQVIFRNMNNIYFKSYESAEHAAKVIIGRDRIKKYLFGVNE